MTYAIHNFLPIPVRKNKYNFDELDVGAHVHIPGKTAKSLYQTVSKAAEKHGVKLVVRDWTEEDDKACQFEHGKSFGAGAMVWRTE